jgi:hypothetical protein
VRNQLLKLLASWSLIGANIVRTASGNRPETDGLYNWSIMGEVFGRPWFRRMWTLQELALSDPDKALVLCGKESIEWSEIIKSKHCMNAVNSDERRPISDATDIYRDLHIFVTAHRNGRVEQLRSMINSKKRDKPIPLISTIFATARRREATDPKDKVFALYGLCSQLDVPMPHPDYAKSMSQIYSEATKAIIQHDRELDVLYLVNTPRRHGNLPSWVPDWSDSWRTEGLYPINVATIYQASNSHALYSFDPDCMTLIVLAKIVDTISLAGDGIPVFEENPGPWGPEIYDRDYPDFMTRNLQIWRAVQGWARHVKQWAEENTHCYGDSPFALQLAFYYTVTQDTPIGRGEMRRSKTDAVNEDKIHDLTAFFKWHHTILDGEKEVETLFLEEGIIKERGELSETITSVNMVSALWKDEEPMIPEFHHNMWEVQRGKAFFMTKGGWMGTAEGKIQEGDVVALVAGLEMPLIVSPIGEHFRVVGHAYVHGLMDGEKWPEALDELELICLV